MTTPANNVIEKYLPKEGEELLSFKAKVSKDLLQLPGSDFIDRVVSHSDRNPQVLRNLCGGVVREEPDLLRW
jgi:class I fructose-bisphosphate aldolase